MQIETITQSIDALHEINRAFAAVHHDPMTAGTPEGRLLARSVRQAAQTALRLLFPMEYALRDVGRTWGTASAMRAAGAYEQRFEEWTEALQHMALANELQAKQSWLSSLFVGQANVQTILLPVPERGAAPGAWKTTRSIGSLWREAEHLAERYMRMARARFGDVRAAVERLDSSPEQHGVLERAVDALAYCSTALVMGNFEDTKKRG